MSFFILLIAVVGFIALLHIDRDGDRHPLARVAPRSEPPDYDMERQLAELRALSDSRADVHIS